MRSIYSLNQHLVVVSPTVILEQIKKTPGMFRLPIKIYRHTKDDLDSDTRFIKSQPTTGTHIATIQLVENVPTITFTPFY